MVGGSAWSDLRNNYEQPRCTGRRSILDTQTHSTTVLRCPTRAYQSDRASPVDTLTNQPSDELALRCRIILACGEGLDNKTAAERVGCSQNTVSKWRRGSLRLGWMVSPMIRARGVRRR